MVQTVMIAISDLWKSKDIHVFAGEGLQVDLIGGPAGAQYVIALRSPGAALPIVQASSGGRIVLSPELLALVPETSGVEYSLWERGASSDLLRRRGRFTVSPTIKTSGLPGLTDLPEILGRFSLGETLTVTPGQWPGVASLSYAWTRADTPIPGALSASYVVQAADVGEVLGVKITARNGTQNVIVVDALNSNLVSDESQETTPPVSVSLAALNATVGAIVSRNLALEFSAGASDFRISAGALPSGIVLSGSGMISGTPSGVAQVSCEVTAVDGGSTLMGTLLISVTAAEISVQGTAYLEAEGQSNIVGFNAVDDLASEQHKVYPDIYGFAVTSGLGTTATQVERQAYTLVPLGQNINGVAGRQGEPNLGASSGGVCPTYGVLKAVDDGALWPAASETWLFKSATSGQNIDEFLPQNTASVWKNKIYGRRFLRTQVLARNEPVFYQAKIWWQGEANTNAPRSQSDLTHADITGYAAKFEAVYAFDEAQMGVQPPWFLIQLSADGGGVADPYTAAINAELQGLCRWRVSLSGAITDSGSGHENRYFVAHDLTNGANVHLTAAQMGQIGNAIATALRTLEGQEGFSSGYAVAPIPVITTLGIAALDASSMTLTLTATDPGSLAVVVVPAGSATPSVPQIRSGIGGNILAAHTEVFSGLYAPGAALSCSLGGYPAGEQIDIHAVLTNGLDSSIASVRGLFVPTLVAGWDETNAPTLLTYSNAGAQVNNTPGATRYARGSISASNGKRYFEIERIGTVAFAGIGRPAVSTGGGANGTDKVGWLFSNVQYTGGARPMGAQPITATCYQLAVDIDLGRFWVRGDGAGFWNNDATANPAAGTGGLDCSGLGGQIVPVAGIPPDATNGAVLHTVSSGWVHAAPSGFVSLG